MAATLCAAHWRPLAREIPEVEELAGRKIDRDGSVVLNSLFFLYIRIICSLINLY